ncbi:MAG TPA: hypothetical protein VMY38_03700 [Gemmatimonadaceae bacterium]|nr:hypothetical protein [Gemmatimonadaceae bacterium]
MRGYSVATAALALGVEIKWLDNLLSQNRVSGVAQSRQGVQRRIQPAALYLIATAYGLNRDLQIPVATALRLARAIWQGPEGDQAGALATLAVGDIAIQLNRADLKERMDQALAEAVEVAPRPKRGRPPKVR